MTAQTTEPTGGAALCRVSVVGGDTQIDLGLPADIPVGALVPDLVALVESRAPERSELEPEPEDRTWHWSLATIGNAPIDPAISLTAAGIRDGDLVILQRAESAQPPALFDDVIDAVATLRRDEKSWSPISARRTGYVVFLLGLLATVAALWQSRAGGASVVPPLAVALIGAGLLVTAVLSSLVYADRTTARILGTGGILTVAGGAGLALPGTPGAAHLLLAAAVVTAASLPLMRVIGAGEPEFTAATTSGALTTVAATVALLTDLPLRQVAAGTAAVALLVLALGPRIAIAAGRLPVPPVPTAGDPIDPGDADSRPTIEAVGAVGATTLPSATRLAERARRADSVLTGITVGSALVVTVAALLMLPGGPSYRWQSVALAAVFGLVVAARGRSHSDLTRATVLVSCGALVLAGVAYSLTVAGAEPALSIGLALMVLLAPVALWAGVVVPRTEHAPTTRRLVEIGEYMLLCSIIPLLFWILGLYSLVRNL